jgi:hypothetical protein
MMKCPFCQYENDDAALYCNQCKSDLGVMQPDEAVQPVVAMAVPAVFTPEAKVSDIPLALPVGEVGLANTPMALPAAAALETTPPVAEIPQEPPPTVPMECSPASVAPSQHVPPLDQTAVQDSTQVISVPPGDSDRLPPGAQPKLVVLRGIKISVEYPVYEGLNYIGRPDERPVDIDLEDQEPPDRIWSSRQHACINYEDGTLVIEDLNSSNGTFVNRSRLNPGQKRTLKANDIIQIGTVQMKVMV